MRSVSIPAPTFYPLRFRFSFPVRT